MSTEEKLLKVVQRLYAKTKAGEIPWEKTSGKGIFQAAFPSYVIKLSSRPNADNPEALDYIASVVDESGIVIERASDLDLSKVASEGGVFSMMGELYTMARRQALGVDGALDSLLGELEKE
jgi:hypothetical protein